MIHLESGMFKNPFTPVRDWRSLKNANHEPEYSLMKYPSVTFWDVLPHI